MDKCKQMCPRLVVTHFAGGHKLEALGIATPTQDRVEDLLFVAVLTDNQLAEVDHTTVAAVRPLVGSFARVVFGGGVEAVTGGRYPYLVHSCLLSRLWARAGERGERSPGSTLLA
jgi:hypothetical protein